MPSFVETLADRVARLPERPAILAPGRDAMSAADLLAQVEAVAELLTAARFTRSSVVALALPNGPDLAVAFLGAMTVTACAPLAVDRPVAEHARDIEAMGASALVVQRGDDTPARAAADTLGLPVLELVPA